MAGSDRDWLRLGEMRVTMDGERKDRQPMQLTIEKGLIGYSDRRDESDYGGGRKDRRSTRIARERIDWLQQSTRQE